MHGKEKTHMNKLFSKIAGSIIGMAMAIGVGVSVGRGEVKEAKAADLSLTFSLTSNPGGWPTTNSTTTTNYTYNLNDVDYTFALNNVKCNSGYLMCTSTAVLGLPALSGYNLTKVIVHNSSGCSTSTKVGISSSDSSASYISGGAIQTWSTQSSSYTYTLTSTTANTMYYLYVTNKNAQIISLDLEYTQAGGGPSASVDLNKDSVIVGTWDFNGVQVEATPSQAYSNPTFSWTTNDSNISLLNASTSTVTIKPANDVTVSGTATVNLAVTENGVATSNASVSVRVGVPISVADARDALDSNAPIENSFVTGIISQIDSYDSTHKSIQYWISDDGTKTNQLEIYSGKGINGADFNSIDGVALKATVVVFGTLDLYKGTYEFQMNSKLVSYEPTKLSLDKYTAYVCTSVSSGTTVTATVTDVASPTYTWTTNDSNITLEGTNTRTVTIKPNTNMAGTATVNLSVGGVSPAILDEVSVEIKTEYTPSSLSTDVGNASDDLENVFTRGIVSQVDSTSLEGNKGITFWFSDNGTTTGQFKAFKCKDLNAADFNSLDDIQCGDEVVVFGTVSKTYSNYNTGCHLVYHNRPVTTLDSVSSMTATVTATVEDDSWTVSDVSVLGTLSGVSDQDVTDYVDVTPITAVPNQPANPYTVQFTVAKKNGIEGDFVSTTLNVTNAVVTSAPVIQTTTINLADASLNDSASGDTSEYVITKGVVSFTITKNGGNNNANAYIGGESGHTNTRVYTNHIAKVDANGNVLLDAVFTSASANGSYTSSNLSSWTNGTASASSASQTNTITADADATYMSCTPTARTDLTQLVVRYYAPNVSATGITINGQTNSSVSITPYQTTKLVTSVLPLDATDRSFEYSISPSGANAIITIDENGLVEPISGKYGDTVVTATSTDGSYTATCTVTVQHVSYYQAVYAPTSTSSVGTSGTLPQGSSATLTASAYGNLDKVQLGATNTDFELVLSGYEGQHVRSVLLKMKSNQNSGSGSLSVVAGATTIGSISTAAFNDESWNGSYSTEWVLIEPEITGYDVQENEDITISITGTVNSIYLAEVRVQYEPTTIDSTAVSFAESILNSVQCDATGATPPSSSSWSTLVSLWNDGVTISATGKQILLDAEATEINNPSTDKEKIQAAMAKYDYIIAKYGNLEDGEGHKIYEDFIGRNPSPLSNYVTPYFGDNNNGKSTSIIITVISVLSLTALGGFFFIKKRKEQ